MATVDPRVQKSGKGLRIMRSENVLEMAIKRLEWIFDEFDNVMVSSSGGKDSTVLFELAYQVAKAKDRLPLNLLFIDQEAEWQATVDVIEEQMTRPGVRPFWLQVPFRIFNATSATDHWLNAWEPGKEDLYVHPHHPIAQTQNVYGTDRFYELFVRVMQRTFGETSKSCSLSGMRAEEAPTRRLGMGFAQCYKWITWGGWNDYRYDQFLFSPLYDWSYTDIWKAIHSHGWPYNRVYDAMYQRGDSPRTMRVSNLHHEHAVNSLFMLQEIEPATYERLVARIEGIHMAATLGKENFYAPKTLPFMFSSWLEYRDFLMAKLIDPDMRPRLERRFYMVDRRTPPEWRDFVYHAECNTIAVNDVEGATLDNTCRNPKLVAAQKRYVQSLGPDPWGDKRLAAAPDQPRAVGADLQGASQRLQPEPGGGS
jgi:predicted phosphoadenosine phosphosulfate sulfurtransferase